MTTPRIVFDPTQNRVHFPLDAGTEVELYDLMFHDADDVKPAAGLTHQGSVHADQIHFRSRFAGISAAHRGADDPASADFPVLTDVIADFDCVSAAWEVGDLAAVAPNGDENGLESQKLVKTTAVELAVGYCVKRAGSATTRVRVRLVSRAAPHEPAQFVRTLSQRLTKSSFTDNANGTAFVDLSTPLPAGALVLGWKAVVHVGFTGDASASVQVGVAGDLDDYSADVGQSVFAAGVVGSKAQANDAGYVKTATNPRVTVSTSTDFADVSESASMTLVLYYLSTQ